MELIKLLNVSTVLVLVLISVSSINGQMLVGGGYTEAYLSQSATDDAAGFVLTIQKPIELIETGKLELSPKLGLSVLNSRAEEEFSPALSTTLHVSPLLGYHIIKVQKLSVLPFAGPFATWVNWLKGGDAIARESTYTSALRFGLEVGVALDLALTENLKMRLIPYSIQYGNEYFRQGNITLGIML